jgi:hypothetical protein
MLAEKPVQEKPQETLCGMIQGNNYDKIWECSPNGVQEKRLAPSQFEVLDQKPCPWQFPPVAYFNAETPLSNMVSTQGPSDLNCSRPRSESSASDNTMTTHSAQSDQSPGYENSTPRTHSNSNISDALQQDDSTLEIAMEVLSKPQQVDKVLKLLGQISNSQMDLHQLVNFLEVQQKFIPFLCTHE